MILDYLGLDHAGHIGGRHSSLMVSKLKEMDDTIRFIHTHSALKGYDHGRRTLLVVVSDHGMTERGNHGGSSYEETDSLALFVDLGDGSPIYSPSIDNEVFQVDITPTLAILFGVPIPKNNVGVLLIQALNALTDEHKLRALELNSWQLLRLLQVHLPGLFCKYPFDNTGADVVLQSNEDFDNIKVKLYNLYLKARAAHALWKLQNRDSSLMSNYSSNLNAAVVSYHDFLKYGSEWLSHRATDKHMGWILTGLVILLMSSFLLIYLLFLQFRDHALERKFSSSLNICGYFWHLDEAFIPFGTLLHVFSLGASSMVEEEQYTWHFLTSTLCLILFYMTIQSLLEEKKTVSFEMKGEEKFDLHGSKEVSFSTSLSNKHVMLMKPLSASGQLSSVLILLICGRILRGWHQGGVNWAHLPDISKWLDQASSSSMKALEVTSLTLLVILSASLLYLLNSKTRYVHIAFGGVVILGFLVLLYIMDNQTVIRSSSIAQIFYFSFGVIVFGTFILSPWALPFHHHNNTSMMKRSNFLSSNMEFKDVLLGIHDSLYVTGIIYASSWSLLQLLLQQPVNAIPILLIFVQTMACIIYFSANGQQHSQFVEVAAMYFLGMTDHFSLGNSNTLATIDIAGAFVGISSHSMILPGILMFIITFSSPILYYLGMVVSISMKDVGSLFHSNMPDLDHALKLMISFPCLLPLAINSVVLTAFTIILLLMRNHLFIWSVFSPKYVYIFAGTVCVYVGVCVVAVTVLYTCTVFFFRANYLKFGD